MVNKYIKEIIKAKEILSHNLPVGTREEVLDAILDLNRRLTKLEGSKNNDKQVRTRKY